MKKIASYIIQEKIFQSNHSTIYRASHEDTEISVIIKMLNVLQPSSANIARLKQEYDLLKGIDVKGVIEYLDLIQDQGNFALILEDFHGKSLKEHMEKQPFSISSFLSIASVVARTIGELHLQNIVHRDIKPGNILASEDLEIVKITDFGLSIQFTQEMMDIYNPNVIEGTLIYMSPEQTGRMNRSVDYRTDIYSLGITFYEMLTGTVPFYSIDPMDIIHSHIAREPRYPTEINPDIPEVLSDIIMKMLAKPAEARYQNSFGLAADIEKCSDEFKKKGFVQKFTLATKDLSLKFNIPQVMVGRENEIHQLLTSFGNISRGQKEIVMVSGAPGIGKSSLLHEIHKPIVAQRGYFITGKYDQFRREVHYSAIIQAFMGLIHQILSESDEMIDQWKEKLIKRLGPNGKIITDVIPAVELIIGKQPDVEELGLVESQNRFMLVFKNFISVFCKSSHPVAIFLDDLQWADSASFNLLDEIISDPELNFLYIIGSYRNNEVDETHQLTYLLKETAEKDISIHHMLLKPLTEENVIQLISNFLHSSESAISSLSNIIYKKTLGNPFFVNQFLKSLYDKKYIKLDQDKGWQWDVTEIEKLEVTENVVELMAEKIVTLSEATINILKVCSCIGNRFELESISVILKKSVEETLKDMSSAITEDLVYLGGDLYRFQHDRIQEAAYSLIPEDEKIQMHYNIGKYLLANTPGEKLYDKILFIIDHFNLSLSLITDEEEKIRIAELNLMAGQKAKKSAAYDSAYHYAITGLELLVPSIQNSTEPKKHKRSMWEKHYQLLYDLSLDALESSYLLRNYSEMDWLASEILKYAKKDLHRGNVYKVQVLALAAQGEIKQSVKTAIRSVRNLGIKMPIRIGPVGSLKYFILMRLLLSGNLEKKLKSLPGLKDPLLDTIFSILVSNGQSLYLVKPLMVSAYAYNIIKKSMKYGMHYGTVYSISTFGLLCVFLGLINTGYRFSEISIKVMEDKKIGKGSASYYFIFNCLVKHWKDHFRTTIGEFKKAIQIALDQGDIESAAYSMLFSDHHLFNSGVFLDEVEEKINNDLKLLKTLKHKTVIKLLNQPAQVVYNLRHEVNDPTVFAGPFSNEKEGRKTNFQYPYIIMLSFLFENYDLAMERSRIVGKRLVGIQGTYNIPVYYFYTSLTCSAIYNNESNKKKKFLWKLIKKAHKKMKKWAKHAPMNYQNKLYLMEAEIARLKNKTKKASKLYDSAIQAARKNEFLQEEAIACELAGKFYLMTEREEFGRYYLTNALNTYATWGASNKVSHMEDKYDFLRVAKRRSMPDQTGSTTVSSTTTSIYNMDVASIIQASQAIAIEIEQDKLLEKIIELAIENAGAQKGFLIMENEVDKKLYIEVQGTVDSVSVQGSIPLEDAKNLPVSIINYVNKTKENLVIQDVKNDERFRNDPFIIENDSKSILCAPLKYKGVVTGIIYLDNNLVASAFTPERLQVLQVLSSQASISIENSRLLVHREEAAKLDTEMKIAENIQTSLLPAKPGIPGYELTAYMKTADEVGGDYYDIINAEGIDWLIIGDVSGHGVTAGLVMMMVQTAIAATIEQNPSIEPSRLLTLVDRTLKKNIIRLKVDKYMTITVFATVKDGEFTFSGLHQDIFIYRAASKKVDTVETDGFWIGMIDDLEAVLKDDKLVLNIGDTMLLFTDGITEAWIKGSVQDNRNPDTHMFGQKLLSEILLENGHLSTDEIRDAILLNLDNYKTDDDVTMVVLKRNQVK